MDTYTKLITQSIRTAAFKKLSPHWPVTSASAPVTPAPHTLPRQAPAGSRDPEPGYGIEVVAASRDSARARLCDARASASAIREALSVVSS